MKKMILLTYVMLTLIGCDASGQNKNLSPDQFEQAIKPGVQLLDVRSAGEFQSGHMANALQADWTNREQFIDRTRHLDKNKTLLVYCLSGGRSAAAATYLRGEGFTDVQELKGGVNAWKMAGKPLEGKSKETPYTLDQYWQWVGNSGRVLVDFGATWCPPCKKMEPVLAALEKDASLQFTLKKIDGGLHTDVMKAIGVNALPTFIVYENGKEVWRHEGVIEQALLAAQLK
jgi:rhodanese-related sulfurtransferase